MKRYQSLKSYFNDKTSYDNVMNIMNDVKENRELRKFFKGVILCCLEAQEKSKKDEHKWMTPDQYFTPYDYKAPYWADQYNLDRLKYQYSQYKKDNNSYVVFGKNVRKFIETMI
jgi:hypothetical protein